MSQENTLEIEFKKEMQRFLSLDHINKTLGQGGLWEFIIFLMRGFSFS